MTFSDRARSRAFVTVLAIGAAAIMALNDWFAPDWRHTVTNAVIEWAVITLLAAALFTVMLFKQPPLWASITIGALVGGAIGGLIWQFKNAPTTTVILLNYQEGVLPSRIPPEPDAIMLLPLRPNSLAAFERHFTSISEGSPLKVTDFLPTSAVRFEVANQTDTLLLDLKIKAVVTFKEAVTRAAPPGATAREAGPTKFTAEWILNIPPLEPKSKFIFYAYNQTALFAYVRPLETGTVRFPNEQKPHMVRIEPRDFPDFPLGPK